MTKETIVLINKKGKPVLFIKEQNEDEIVLVRKVKQESSLANKRIVIHTIDIEKLREFQNTPIQVEKRSGFIDKILGKMKSGKRQRATKRRRN